MPDCIPIMCWTRAYRSPVQQQTGHVALGSTSRLKKYAQKPQDRNLKMPTPRELCARILKYLDGPEEHKERVLRRPYSMIWSSPGDLCIWLEIRSKSVSINKERRFQKPFFIWSLNAWKEEPELSGRTIGLPPKGTYLLSLTRAGTYLLCASYEDSVVTRTKWEASYRTSGNSTYRRW